MSSSEKIVAVGAGALEEKVAIEEEAASDAEETAVACAEGAAMEKGAIAIADDMPRRYCANRLFDQIFSYTI